MPNDCSNGYDAIADEYMAVRSASGQALVRKWAASIPFGASIVDVGAGSGEPLTSVLVEAGLSVSAIEASPKMAAAFRRRFPDIEVACEPAEDSQFFNRTFDAAMAIGLIFLLPEESQHKLIGNIADALEPSGRFLFSAPRQACRWSDAMTGGPSLSLGAKTYRQLLATKSLALIDEQEDEGGNYYYEAQKV